MTAFQTKNIGWDGPPVKFVEKFLAFNQEYHESRLRQYKRDYKLFNAILDLANRDPERANIFIPKLMQIIRQKVPNSVKSLYGIRPYIPFEAQRDEFKEMTKGWVEFIDTQLENANWFINGVMCELLTATYGTAFIDATFYYKPYEEPIIEQTPFGPVFSTEVNQRLKIKLQTYAPWEVITDRYSTNLEEEGGCRGLCKIVRTSKRLVKKMALMGAYGPDFDVEKLDHATYQLQDSYITKADWGWQVLAGVGFNEPAHDNDMCVIIRFESEDRYVDVYNGKLDLRDIDNPHPDGLIHTTRRVNELDPHTANQFYGVSEIKPNEVFQHLKNDLYSRAIDIWNMISQPLIYYRKGAGINVDDLVYEFGNRVPIGGDIAQPIDHYVREVAPRELPASYFVIEDNLDKMMDDVATFPEPSQGKLPDADMKATIYMKAEERAANRQEMNIAVAEHTYLADFGRKLISTLSKAVGLGDLIETIGFERAIMAYFLGNPTEIPGGYNLKFKGSNKIASQLIKQHNWIAIKNDYIGNPQVAQEYFLRKQLELFEMDDPEALQAIYPDDLMLALMGAGDGSPDGKGAPVGADGDSGATQRRILESEAKSRPKEVAA